MLKAVVETPKTKPRKTGEGHTTSDDIYEQIYVALLEHRLVPGTTLAEERLASIFGVNQARDVFEARRIIEPAVIQRLARSMTPKVESIFRQ